MFASNNITGSNLIADTGLQRSPQHSTDASQATAAAAVQAVSSGDVLHDTDLGLSSLFAKWQHDAGQLSANLPASCAMLVLDPPPMGNQ